jgi:endonuclease/exonuclease/phosphatase (EEP) superfamily protein YafD
MIAIMADEKPGEADLSSLLGSIREAIGRTIIWATWGYALLILAALVLIRWVGEAWWGVAVLLFVPRWLFLGPVALLAIASGLVRRPSPWVRQWAMQGAIALVIAGPLMGFMVPLARLVEPRVEGDRIRVLTYNVAQDSIDGKRLVEMIERERIDLICFQERMLDKHVEAFFASRGWHRSRSRAVASRFPILDDLEPPPGEFLSEDRHPAVLTRVRLRAPSGTEFVLASAHLPTIRKGFERLFAGKVWGLEIHLAWWRHEMERVIDAFSSLRGTPIIVGGDFNMPAEDSTMAALGSSFRSAFDEAGWGYGYTRPARYPWCRIDHLLASPEWGITRCWVGPDFGSDHLPLLAEFVLPAPPRRPGSQAR